MNKVRFRRFIGPCVSIILCLFLFACGSSPQKSQSTATLDGAVFIDDVNKALFDQALASLAKNEFKSAEKDLKILLTRRDDIAEVWVNYALSLYHQKKYDELESALKAIQDNKLSTPQSNLLSGIEAVRKGQFQQANTYYSRSVKQDPTYAQAWYNLGLLHDVYLQDVASAIGFYEKYLALVPEDQQAKDWLEHLRFSLGDGL